MEYEFTPEETTSQRRTGTINSVIKAMELTRVMLDIGEPVPLHVLSKMTGYPKSTAYAILSTMREHNFITQTSDGRYFLGMSFYECGQAVSRSWNIMTISRPYLERLSRETKSTSILSINDNESIYNIDYVCDGSDIQLIPVLAKPLPLNASSQGKLFLASLSASARMKYFEKNEFETFTDKTITDPEKLSEDIKTVIHQNYAVSEGEYIQGMRFISAPIYDHTGRFKYCISILGIAKNIPRSEYNALIEKVRQAAAAISAQIGYQK